MSRPVLVLRPAPGDAATAARLAAAGLQPIRLPLFGIAPLAWGWPTVGAHDAVLLTSANAVRHAGAALERVRGLPAIAVGQATADAARAAGLDVVAIGDGNAVAALALARARGLHRIVRLTGRERTLLDGVADIIVYASEPLPLPAGALAVARGAVALLHSTRAARHFAGLLERDGVARADVRLAAISGAVMAAAGEGWGASAVAATPDDAVLVDAAATLAIDR